MSQDEEKYLHRVAALGCVACRLSGHYDTPAEIHHPRAGTGMGKRASHYDAIPLCPAHHRGTAGLKVPSIHGSKNAFVKMFGTEQSLLEYTRGLLDGVDDVGAVSVAVESAWLDDMTHIARGMGGYD